MMDFLLLVVAILASYRITRFIVKDSLIGFGSDSTWQGGEEVIEFASPWGERLDAWAFTDGEPRSWVRGKVGDLMSCTFCVGFWVSCGVTGLLTWAVPGTYTVASWIVLAFAVAGGQALLNYKE